MLNSFNSFIVQSDSVGFLTNVTIEKPVNKTINGNTNDAIRIATCGRWCYLWMIIMFELFNSRKQQVLQKKDCDGSHFLHRSFNQSRIFSDKHISEFLPSKCVHWNRESINDSEESSVKEIVSRRKITNKISSSSSSDDDESYASKDLDEMLEKFTINKGKELTIVDISLDNIQWNEFANKQQSFSLEKVDFCWIYHLIWIQVKFFRYFWMKKW